jgi:hypothetical protein
MIIYGSTIWVDPSEHTEWYKLEVINQWDWIQNPICYQKIDGNLISFSLIKCTSINNEQYVTEKVTELSQEMKDELIKMGYTL